MTERRVPALGALLALLLVATSSAPSRAEEPARPLPSWRDGASRDALVGFVERVTTPGGPDYLEPSARIAVFDNDGTLWSENPMYVQLAFVLDRVRELAPRHPAWKTTPPFQAALEGDLEALAAAGKEGLLELIGATHAGMSPEEFERIVTAWLAKARHPKLDRPYTECVYQPMLELLAYLRAHGFKTFIVSAGGIDFMRPWTEAVYGIPPEQVVGSSIQVEYDEDDGTPRLRRLPDLRFLDDGPGKPVAMHYHIGRRPVLAFGNSDGDFEMLAYTTAGAGPRLGLLLHHDDAEREAAYDRESPIGRLARGLDEASSRGWVVVSMRKDWTRIFPKR